MNYGTSGHPVRGAAQELCDFSTGELFSAALSEPAVVMVVSVACSENICSKI